MSRTLRVLVYILSITVLIINTQTVFADKNASIIFLQDMPAELSNALHEHLAEISTENQISAASQLMLKRDIATLDPRGSVYNDTHTLAIQKLGVNAVPVIAELLLSTDELIREKSVRAIYYLLKQEMLTEGEHLKEEEAGVESAAILLFHRSLLDKSAKVRMQALRGLLWVGHVHRGNLSEMLRSGLDLASRDPDRFIRERARIFKESFSLVPSRNYYSRTGDGDVFIKETHLDIEAELSNEIMRLRRIHPLRKEDLDEIRCVIVDKRHYSRQDELKKIRKIRDAETTAIFVISELLVSQDENMRMKAVKSLTLFTSPVRHPKKKYDEMEHVIILLLRRSAMDSNKEIRRLSIGGISALGRGRKSEIPDGVRLGLEESLNHPDPVMRYEALRIMQELVLAPDLPINLRIKS